MYRTKPLEPFDNDEQIHLQHTDTSDEEDFTDKWADDWTTDGYRRIPTLCGEKLASKRNVLLQIKEDEVCSACLRIARKKELRPHEFIRTI